MTQYGLGRNLNHDPRSLNFPARAGAPGPVLWKHYGPVLDQGQVGSCTGNAMAQALNTKPFHAPRSKYLTEQDALNIYSKATQIDGINGSYPPDDTGSDGLSVAKVAVSLGLISSYNHAFGIDHARGALQLSPVLFGTVWTEGMFTPDAKGVVSATGAVAGGHEYLCVGDDGKGMLKFLNSWSSGWGKKGFFYMTYDTAASLLNQQGDVTVPVK